MNSPLSPPPQMSLATLVPGGQPPLGEEPLYVNAKQYHRIIKRREARSRQESLYRAAKKEKAKEVCFCAIDGCIYYETAISNHIRTDSQGIHSRVSS
jgi:hypothetical protein